MNKTQSKKIDKTEVVEVNTPKCSLFGSFKLNNPACTKCETKFLARNKACKELTKTEASKKNVKKITGTHLDCFNAAISSDTHKFILEIAKNPLTMKAIKACSWNTRPNTFYCKAKTLIKNGNMRKNKSGTFELTAKGKKKLAAWKEAQKVSSRKVA